MQTNQKILVTGTLAFDHLFSYDSTFLDKLRTATTAEVLSVSFQPDVYNKKYGGTGANIAWNLALLGVKPVLVGKVGQDGDEYVEELSKRGVDVRYIEMIESSMTSTGFCCTDSKGHQIWFFYRGADAVGHWPSIKTKKNEFACAIIGARNPAKMIEGLEWCKDNDVPSLFDPGQYILDFQQSELQQALKLATGLIANEFECDMLKKALHKNEYDIAKNLEYFIVTKGGDGYDLYAHNTVESFDRCACDKPVNPTGAGDAFRAGFCYGLRNGLSYVEASKIGATLASFVVEQAGALLDSLDRKKLEKRFEETYGYPMPHYS